MKREVVTVRPTDKVSAIAHLIHEERIWHLPVTADDGSLVGLISQGDVQRAVPSAMTTLSVGEVNYLTSKLTVEKIMQTDLFTTSADTLVEEAARSMQQHDVGCLPVVEGDQLIGIITIYDLLSFFLDITGCTVEQSARIALHRPDKSGELARLLETVTSFGAYIATVVSPMTADESCMRIVILRYRHDNPADVDEHLIQEGFEIISERLPEMGDTE